MPMVVSDKRRIFYRFEGERGAFLLLHHELFGSHTDWYRLGYVDALAREFRLIVMDARGHGRSDRPEEPEAYSLSAMAADVLEVMNCLDIRNLHFLGYGLGALVGFELLTHHAERMRIALLGGESPFVTEELRSHWAQQSARLEGSSLAVLLEDLRAQKQLLPAGGMAVGEPAPEVDEATQYQPAQSMLRSLAEWPLFTEGRVVVNSPVTLYAGMDDPAAGRVEAARRTVHRARFVPFANLNHVTLLEERELLMGEVLRLLKTGKRQPERGEDAGGRSYGGDPRGDSRAPERSDSRHQDRRGGGERRHGAPRGNGSTGSATSTPPEEERIGQRRCGGERRKEPQVQDGGLPPEPPRNATPLVPPNETEAPRETGTPDATGGSGAAGQASSAQPAPEAEAQPPREPAPQDAPDPGDDPR